MSVLKNEPREATPAPMSEMAQANLAAARRRRITVNILRVVVLIVIVGGWELGSRTGIIDPFFWGQPSGIWAQIVTWVLHGTAQGPLWVQVGVTLEETILGFIIGVVLGVVFGV